MAHLGNRKPVHPDLLNSWVDRAIKAEAEIEKLRAAMQEACVLLLEQAHGPARLVLRTALGLEQKADTKLEPFMDTKIEDCGQ